MRAAAEALLQSVGGIEADQFDGMRQKSGLPEARKPAPAILPHVTAARGWHPRATGYRSAIIADLPAMRHPTWRTHRSPRPSSSGCPMQESCQMETNFTEE